MVDQIEEFARQLGVSPENLRASGFRIAAVDQSGDEPATVQSDPHRLSGVSK